VPTIRRSTVAEVSTAGAAVVAEHIAGHPEGFRDCAPRWDLYAEFERDDACAMWVVEHDDLIVGYAILLRTPHMHSARMAYVLDALFVRPEFRGVDRAGGRLFDEIVAEATAWAGRRGDSGNAVFVWAAPGELAAWMGRKGFTVLDINYAKVI